MTELIGYSISYIEIFGVFFYFLSVYLAIRVNVLTWMTGILSSILFIILYIDAQTYANAFLQIILIFICIKGWIEWKKVDVAKISKLKNKKILFIVILTTLSILFLGSIMSKIAPDPYPYLDMSIFILSIVGSILLAYKKIESWYAWILVNLLTLILYLPIGYYLISIQSLILIVFDIIALKEWNKELFV